MKFINVKERPDGATDSILGIMPVADDAGQFNLEQEAHFVNELMSRTTDNISVELEPHEELFILIDNKIGFNISRHSGGNTVFNLGSYLKLLAPAQSVFTYFVVLDRQRTDSVAVKELMSAERVSCSRRGQEVCDIFSGASVKIGK